MSTKKQPWRKIDSVIAGMFGFSVVLGAIAIWVPTENVRWAASAGLVVLVAVLVALIDEES